MRVSFANPWPGLFGTPAKASHGNPASTFPHELRIASTYVMRPCCRYESIISFPCVLPPSL